jgi:hypothetical protein
VFGTCLLFATLHDIGQNRVRDIILCDVIDHHRSIHLGCRQLTILGGRPREHQTITCCAKHDMFVALAPLQYTEGPMSIAFCIMCCCCMSAEQHKNHARSPNGRPPLRAIQSACPGKNGRDNAMIVLRCNARASLCNRRRVARHAVTSDHDPCLVVVLPH